MPSRLKKQKESKYQSEFLKKNEQWNILKYLHVHNWLWKPKVNNMNDLLKCEGSKTQKFSFSLAICKNN